MEHRENHDARIMIVDDRKSTVLLIERILGRAGYRDIVSTTDSREAVQLFIQSAPDLVMLDLHMPHLDGLELLTELQPLIGPRSYLPVIVLTADDTPELRNRALSLGAKDFLVKPIDPTEATLRIKNLIEARTLHGRLLRQNDTLERKVRERTRELEDAQLEALDCLARAAEYRDDDTGKHTQRVGVAAALVAENLALGKRTVELMRRAAPLHDVGKIGVPDQVLLKPGRLTVREFEIVKGHASIGANILSGSRFEVLQLAEVIARSHHERWDGCGYPSGLERDAIPLSGRIVAIVDVFDALTHERPYKKAWSVDDALREIQSQSGTQFDPEVVAAFLSVQDLARDAFEYEIAAP
ncbi:MAG: HD-GYP domain-containing protein [Actinomycetota bacterium]